MESQCHTCKKIGATKQCSRCHSQRYCSRECQQQDWKEHKKICPPDGAASQGSSHSTWKDVATLYCAHCYAEDHSTTCDGCQRLYCSAKCNTQDWSEGGHHFFCGRSGELGSDFEIRESPDKQGFGVFVLREFAMGELIMTEKPVLQLDSTKTSRGDFVSKAISDLPKSMFSAVKGLHPASGSLYEKFKENCMACGESEEPHTTGLLVTMSRVNNDCIGNADHRYVQALDCIVLRANHTIAAGEEVTFPYIAESMNRAKRQKLLTEVFGFQCKCRACLEPEVDLKLARIDVLDRAINNADMDFERSIGAARELLAICDELQYTPQFYARTYYDLFQVLMYAKKPIEDCHEAARKANEYAEMCYEECEPQLQNSRRRMADPEGYFREKSLGPMSELCTLMKALLEHK